MLKISIEFIELEKQNFHPLIFSEINGKKAHWIIDTGASKTVFDISRTADYNLLSEEDEIHSIEAAETPRTTSLAEVKSIQFGSVEIGKLKVALINLSHVNLIYKNASAPEICGLIGSDFLLRYKAIIDFKNKALFLDF